MNKVTLKLLNSKLIKNIIASPLVINDHMPDEFYQKILVDEVVDFLDKDDLENIIYYIHDDSIKFQLLTKESVYNKLKYYKAEDIIFNEQSYYFKLISFLESKDAYPCISTFLRDIKDEELVTELLLSIKFHRLLFSRVRELSDYNKIKFFDLVEDKYKSYLISIIDNDNIKIRYLNRFSFYERLSIICNLNNDIYKIKYLKDHEYLEHRDQILRSIKNESILFDLYNSIKNKEDKISFIITINNPHIKYMLYNNTPDLTVDEKILIAYNILTCRKDENSEMVKELFEVINSECKPKSKSKSKTLK